MHDDSPETVLTRVVRRAVLRLAARAADQRAYCCFNEGEWLSNLAGELRQALRDHERAAAVAAAGCPTREDVRETR